MALNKSHLFTETDKQLARWAKALAHPARIAILKVLAKRCTCLCGDITEEVPLAQSTVSQHLKVLKQAGLIQGDIEGTRTCYCLSDEGVKLFREHITQFAEELDQHHQPSSCTPKKIN